MTEPIVFVLEGGVLLVAPGDHPYRIIARVLERLPQDMVAVEYARMLRDQADAIEAAAAHYQGQP